ncbi:MAG: ATPase [Fuscovulum sp.]|nr:ATPase [Fuscovulum sp.]
MTFLLGIDGGGTGCRAVVAAAGGQVLAQATAGPANVATDLAGAAANILSAAQQALQAVGLDPASDQVRTGLGLAGANARGTDRALAGLLPFRHLRLATDAIATALGALGPDDGILAAIGTGSVFVVQQSGQLRQYGGWGLALGDEGSGARIGRAILAQALRMAEGRAAPTPLLQALLDEMGGSEGVIGFAAGARPADLATLAPRVLAADDPAAALVRDASAAEVAATLAELQPDPPLPVVVTGGLAAFHAPRLALRWPQRPPRGTALDGALILAQGAA